MLNSAVNSAMDKIWNDKHLGKDFAPDPKNDVSLGLMPVEKLSDMFNFSISSDYDIERPEVIKATEEFNKLMKIHVDYGGEKPKELAQHMNEDNQKLLKEESDLVKSFYNSIYGLSSID